MASRLLPVNSSGTSHHHEQQAEREAHTAKHAAEREAQRHIGGHEREEHRTEADETAYQDPEEHQLEAWAGALYPTPTCCMRSAISSGENASDP